MNNIFKNNHELKLHSRNSERWKINTKVIHMWEYKERDVTTSIHLILVDEKGISIMAWTGKFTMPTHSNSCVLGKPYFLFKIWC